MTVLDTDGRAHRGAALIGAIIGLLLVVFAFDWGLILITAWVGASVVADVVEHIRGEKKIAFKMKRRKGYRKTIGHRQELTVVKIKEIKV